MTLPTSDQKKALSVFARGRSALLSDPIPFLMWPLAAIAAFAAILVARGLI